MKTDFVVCCLRKDELQKIIQQNESVIQMLQVQLHQAQTDGDAVEETEVMPASEWLSMSDCISGYL